MIRSDSVLRPFNPTGYEIFDEDYDETGEVVIWSRATLAPQPGDLFDIELHGVVRELAVEEVRTFQGGWSVVCRDEA
jgi:hypothetical protein